MEQHSTVTIVVRDAGGAIIKDETFYALRTQTREPAAPRREPRSLFGWLRPARRTANG